MIENQIPGCVCCGDKLLYRLKERDGELHYALICRYCHLSIYLSKVEDYSQPKKKDEYFYSEEQEEQS